MHKVDFTRPQTEVLHCKKAKAKNQGARGVLWFITFGVVGLVGVVAAILGGAYSATQSVPQFYQEAMILEPKQVAVAGEELEREVLELHNEARRAGHWEAVFTEEQINSWLSVDLPKKFPRALPAQIGEPRIAIRDTSIFLACRYSGDRLKTILSLQVEASLTENENEIALRIRSIRAGLLPLPMKRFMEAVNRRARSSSIPVRWSQVEGDPLALLQAPEYYEELSRKRVRIEEILVTDGAIKITGRTEVDLEASAEVLSASNFQVGDSENAALQQ